MNAKHSAILLSGLLLLMIGLAWAQSSNKVLSTCPAVVPQWNANWRPSEGASKWVRADWNAKANHWEIDCDSELPSGNATKAAANAIPISGRDLNKMFNSANWNAAANAVNAPAQNANTVRHPRSVRREPNTRRPGE